MLHTRLLYLVIHNAREMPEHNLIDGDSVPNTSFKHELSHLTRVPCEGVAVTPSRL